MNISSVVDIKPSEMNTSTFTDAERIAQLTTIGLLLTRYVLLVIITLSVVGNTLNIVVFCQQKLRSNPCTIYLLAAACFSLIYTVDAIFSRILSTYNLDFSAQITPLCKVRHFIFFTCASLSVWMMALATFDRFLISSPLARYRQLSSFTNTYRLIGITTLLLSANYANLFYCADIKGIPPSASCTSITTRICGLYNELARILTVAIIPGSMMFVFGMGTIQHLKKVRTAVGTALNNNTQPQHRMRKTDRELIQMLIGQIVMIFISWTPHAIQRLYTVITIDEVKSPLRSRQDTLWDQVTWIVTTFDISLSFYIYLFTGSVLFRQTLRQMFGCITPTTRTTTLGRTQTQQPVRQI